MLTYQDCLGMCSLCEEEIHAIAQHESLPEIVALEYAEYVVHLDDGNRLIRRIIFDDIEAAEATGNQDRVETLRWVMKHFIATHPERDGAPSEQRPERRPENPSDIIERESLV